jgi:rubrerythrin
MENASMYEVLQLAINLEEEGTKFYEKWASKAKGNVKEMLKKLAMDETKHATYFKGLFDGLKDKPEVDYLFEEDVTAYFKTYANSAAFNREQVKLNSIREAVEEGIQTEKNSIEYYEFLLKHSKESTKEMLDKIIKEEQGHLVILEKLLPEA